MRSFLDLFEVSEVPIYEYRCESCGEALEKLQKISDPKLVDCPSCNEPSLVKMVSASSFRLKGSGWYETDFKTGKKKNGVADSKADSTSSTGQASDSSKKTAEKKLSTPSKSASA